jgi:chromosomal replication initiation ATPase DnaA
MEQKKVTKSNEPKTFNEWQAHYFAVKQRLGGVGASAGVVPVAMVAKEISMEIRKTREQIEAEQKAIEAEKAESFFRINKIPKNNFYRLLIKVAKEHDVSPEILVSANRQRNIVKARNQLVYEAHNVHLYSYAQIGRWLGKDHTSIIHAANRYADSIGVENVRS